MQPALERQLGLCSDLPSPPGIALQVIERYQDPETSIRDIAVLVAHDPALSARILRLANAPAYARQREVGNVRQAVALFGLRGTMVLTLGISVVEGVGSGPLDHDRLWRRAVARAIAAQLLAARSLPRHKEDAFLCGLLQDIGLLALLRIQPDLYAGIDPLADPPEQVLAHERRRLGTDHLAASAWLLRRWNFPAHLPEALDHAALDCGQGHGLGQVLVVAGAIGDAWWQHDSDAAIARATELAARCLRLPAAAFSAVIEATGDQLEEAAAAFGIDAAAHVPADLLMGKAQELMQFALADSIRETALLRERAERLVEDNTELKEKTRRDSLTGLYNRDALNAMLEAEFEVARENDFPLAVAFIDLDRFKQINDRYGHNAGDRALIHCARLIQENLRQSDIVARYGGEEFVLVLPGTDREGAAVVCNRILESLRSTPLVLEEGEEIRVTASIGVGLLGEAPDAREAADLLRLADRALYSAKRHGRDQLRFYGE